MIAVSYSTTIEAGQVWRSTNRERDHVLVVLRVQGALVKCVSIDLIDANEPRPAPRDRCVSPGYVQHNYELVDAA